MMPTPPKKRNRLALLVRSGEERSSWSRRQTDADVTKNEKEKRKKMRCNNEILSKKERFHDHDEIVRHSLLAIDCLLLGISQDATNYKEPLFFEGITVILGTFSRWWKFGSRSLWDWGFEDR